MQSSGLTWVPVSARLGPQETFVQRQVMHFFRSAATSIALLGVLASLAPALGAQKLARNYFEDSHNGFRVKPLRPAVPWLPSSKARP